MKPLLIVSSCVFRFAFCKDVSLNSSRDNLEQSITGTSWITECPYHVRVANHLCDNDFDRVIRYFASGSCFDADYERELCCPTEPGAITLPGCFIPDGFNSLNERLCCKGDLTTLRIPDLVTGLVDERTHGHENARCIVNGERVRINLGDAIRDVCPEAEKPYALVIYLWGALQGKTRAPPALDLDNWLEGIKGRYPVFGLLNAFSLAPDLKKKFKFDPIVDLTEDPQRQAVAYLYMAIEYFDAKDTRWQQLVKMAQASFGKYGFTGEIEAHVNYLLDYLWTQWDPPKRWRHIEYDKATTWNRLFEAVPKLQKILPDYDADPKFNYDLAKANFTNDTPGWARPFLHFLDDVALYPNSGRQCRQYEGIIKHLRDRRSEEIVVLDVGAGTAPCEQFWRSAGQHVRYLKQDFASYDAEGGPKPQDWALEDDQLSVRHARLQEIASKNGVNVAAYGSSIHVKGGYAELDIVSDVTSIPLDSGSVDVIICDQVLEHPPNPVEAITEMRRSNNCSEIAWN